MDEIERFFIEMQIRELTEHPLSTEMIRQNPELSDNPEFQKMVEEQKGLERNAIETFIALLESN